MITYETLKTSGEITKNTAFGNIKSAFRRLMTANKTDHFDYYAYKAESINNHIVKILIQAVGRICRTKNKNTNINIYVDEKAYSVYQGISLANDIQKPFPPAIYNYRQYDGISTDDERLENYLKTVIDYFKTVAEVINVNDIK